MLFCFFAVVLAAKLDTAVCAMPGTMVGIIRVQQYEVRIVAVLCITGDHTPICGDRVLKL